MVTALLITARAVQIGTSILIAGIFTFQLIPLGLTAALPTKGDLREVERRLLRLALWSLVTALLSALLWFWVEVASMSGVSLASAFSIIAWRTVLFETEFGRVWQLRFGLIAVVFALITSGLAQDEARRMPIVIRWLLGIVLLGSLAWISHAAAARVQPLGLLGDTLHLCAAGTWLGGLVSLAIFLARAGAAPSSSRAAASVLQRFSTLSLCCVGVLVLSGISNTWLLVGSIHALFTTSYGRLLLFKLALFGILLGFGARNRFVVKAKLLSVPADSALLSQVRRNVICEAFLGLAIVAIVACLGETSPRNITNL